jgi:hypothetical protein
MKRPAYTIMRNGKSGRRNHGTNPESHQTLAAAPA